MKPAASAILLLSAAVALAGCGQSQSSSSADTIGPCGGLPVTSGLQVWLDASSLSAADGAALSSWGDCSNPALSAVQSSAANQPKFSATGGADGHPAVLFDGAHSGLSIPAAQVTLAGPDMTIFAVTQLASYGDLNFRYLLYKSTGTDGFSVAYFRDSLLMTIGGQGQLEGGVYGGNPFYLMNLVDSGDAVTEYQNGEPTGVAPGVGAWSSSTSDLYLFARKLNNGTWTEFVSGSLSELIIYNSALSTSDRESVQCYLNEKYNLGLGVCG